MRQVSGPPACSSGDGAAPAVAPLAPWAAPSSSCGRRFAAEPPCRPHPRDRRLRLAPRAPSRRVCAWRACAGAAPPAARADAGRAAWRWGLALEPPCRARARARSRSRARRAIRSDARSWHERMSWRRSEFPGRLTGNLTMEACVGLAVTAASAALASPPLPPGATRFTHLASAHSLSRALRAGEGGLRVSEGRVRVVRRHTDREPGSAGAAGVDAAPAPLIRPHCVRAPSPASGRRVCSRPIPSRIRDVRGPPRRRVRRAVPALLRSPDRPAGRPQS